MKGQLLGRPTLGKYLLSGLLRCPCGANFEYQKRDAGYTCSAHRRRGPSVCANGLVLPLAETDERILGVIEGAVLNPAFIEVVLNTVFAPDAVDRLALEAERHELERQMANLTEAIKIGGNIPTLVEELKCTNLRLRDVRGHFVEPSEQLDREHLRRALEHRVAEWKSILRENPAQGRQVIAHLLGPIDIRLQDGADLQALVDAGIDLNDRSGKENITLEDITMPEEQFREMADSMRQIAGMVVWSAQARPEGLLIGLRAGPTIWRALQDSNLRPPGS